MPKHNQRKSKVSWNSFCLFVKRGKTTKMHQHKAIGHRMGIVCIARDKKNEDKEPTIPKRVGSKELLPKNVAADTVFSQSYGWGRTTIRKNTAPPSSIPPTIPRKYLFRLLPILRQSKGTVMRTVRIRTPVGLIATQATAATPVIT